MNAKEQRTRQKKRNQHPNKQKNLVQLAQTLHLAYF